MRIYFLDGSYADCSEIQFYGDVILWDHERYENITNVERIETVSFWGCD